MKIDFVLFFNVADNGISYGYRQPYVIADVNGEPYVIADVNGEPYVIADVNGGDYYSDDNDDIIVIIRLLYILYEN